MLVLLVMGEVLSRALDDCREHRETASMPKKKQPEVPPKEQFQEFVKTARELGVDETGEALERAFKTLAPKKRAQKQTTRKR